jgi:hypothetical protein
MKHKALNNIISPRNRSWSSNQIMRNHIVCFRLGCYCPQAMCQSYLTPKGEKWTWCSSFLPCTQRTLLLCINWLAERRTAYLLDLHPMGKKTSYCMKFLSCFVKRTSKRKRMCEHQCCSIGDANSIVVKMNQIHIYILCCLEYRDIVLFSSVIQCVTSMVPAHLAYVCFSTKSFRNGFVYLSITMCI